MMKKKSIISILLSSVFFFMILIGCKSSEENLQKKEQQEMIKKAHAIIEKYGIDKGSFKVLDESELNSNSQDGKSNSKIQPLNMESLEEFEKFVASIAKYQNSKEGKISKKLHDFHLLRKNTNLSEKKIDSFYLALDKEFGTDYFNQLRGELPKNAVRYSSWDQ